MGIIQLLCSLIGKSPDKRPNSPLLEGLEPRLLLDGIPPLLELSAVPNIDVGATYYLRADATPQHGQDIVQEYTIDWGEGGGLDVIPTTAEVLERSHVYINPGDYTITVRVSDDDGDQASETIGLTVEELDITLAPMGGVILTRNDDGSTAAQSFGFDFEFYGQTYTEFYINNNGNITFSEPYYSYVPTGFPQGTSNPMIAPFWSDVDTRATASGEVHMATGVSARGNPFVQIDWPGVGYFSQNVDKLNTFTLYIEDDPRGDIVAFDYGQMQWTTGDVTGIDGFGTDAESGAQIGYDAGDGEHYVSFGRPYNSAMLAPFSNMTLVFRLAEGPLVEDLDLTTGQDTPITDGQVVGQDPEGDPLDFSVVDDPTDGTVLMALDGSFVYTPDLGFYGVDTFTFEATDPGAMVSNLGTVTITVNDPPTAQNLAWSTDEDVTANGQTVGLDIQPQEITYSLVSQPDHGALDFADDGSFTYIPDADFNGTDEFTFQVTDGIADSNVGTVSVTVAPVNDVPTADPQTVITVEDGVVVITLTGSDLETDSGDLVFTITQAPAHGGYIQAGNQITYTATPGYSGLDSFQFTVTDTGDPDGGDQGWGFAAAAASSAATVEIGVPIKENFDPDGTLALTTDEGTSVLFSIEGQGTGWLYHFGGIAFDTPLDVSRLVLAGTNAQTDLKIHPDGAVVLGDVLVNGGSLHAILAPTTDLIGNVEVATGSLAELHMQNASDGVLTVGVLPPGATLNVNLQQVTDFGIDSAIPIYRLTAVDWVNTDAQADEVIVPWVRNLKTTGRRANGRLGIEASDGDFDADLTASGAGLPADSLVLDKADIKGSVGGHWQLDGPAGTIFARGGMQGGTIELNHDPTSATPALLRGNFGIVNGSSILSTGNLWNLKIGAMVDSNLFAGVINWLPGDGLPDLDTQIDTASPAYIRRLNVRGARVNGWYVDSFDNSNIAAYSLGTVSIRNASVTNTGVEYGISAWQAGKIVYCDRDRVNNWAWPDRRGNVLASASDLTVDLGITGVDSFLAGERVARDRTQDAGFAYTDIDEVSIRALGGWVHIGIRTSEPLQDPLSDMMIRITLDTNADSLSVLTNHDALSDYCIDWTMSGDTVEVWTGGGHTAPLSWTQIDAPTAYTTLTDEGVVVSVPLSAFEDASRPAPGYEYVRLVEAMVLRDMEVVDAAG